MKRWLLFLSFALAGLLTLGCATLDEKQRAWIFQPSDRAWGGSADFRILCVGVESDPKRIGGSRVTWPQCTSG